jgi:hypothetical protein
MVRPSASVVALLGTLWAAAPLRAEPARVMVIDGVPQRRLAIDTPSAVSASPLASVSPTIYLERCAGGCTIRYGANNDARTNTSSIPKVLTAMIGEFMNSQQQRGRAADAEWGQIVQCMREVYSPFNVSVTDVRPAGSYHQVVVAGQPTDIGLEPDVLGVAPLASDCRAIDNVISFTFANHHPPADRVLNICWTAAQESAHAFGLDHQYAFSGNRSACSDPMTYRNDCGGEKFFRNEPASCGEYSARACKCGASQNSHQKLLSVFGPGTSIVAPPTITMLAPVVGGALGRSVTAQAGSKRGVARVEAWFNGFPWAATPGAPFGVSGQANPSAYAVAVPAALPDGVIDVQAVAFDDLGATTRSAPVTLTKGLPCTTATSCATGQKCEAGKCFWDPPSGEIGDSCTYPQLCKSLQCQGATGRQVCTQDCIPGVADACPDGSTCVANGGGTGSAGACLLVEGGGCCRVDRSRAGGLPQAGLAALVLGVVARRRRRRPAG